MKYEKHFTLEELSFETVGYYCPSLELVISDIASSYNRAADASAYDYSTDLRNAIDTAMVDGLDEYIKSHDVDASLEIWTDELEDGFIGEHHALVAKGFTVKANSPVTLSIARDIFASFDHDELMKTIEDEFVDALISWVKNCPNGDASNEVASVEAEIVETSATIASEPVAVSTVEADFDDLDIDDAEEVEYEEVEEAAEVAEAEPIAEAPIEPSPIAQEVAETKPSLIDNLHDPDGLLTKYAANFADICSVPDIAAAQQNVMTREGNNIVLTSTIVSEPGYKLVTVTKFDAKNKGKQCRTTENDGNKTNLWTWRTPSLYGWALDNMNDDGTFSDDVLGKSLVEKGAGSCKAWGVRFIKTSAADRSAARSRSSVSKQIAQNGAPTSAPAKPSTTAEQKPVCAWYVLADEWFYIANPKADTSLVAYYDGEAKATECDIKSVANATSYLKTEGFELTTISEVPSDAVIAIGDAIEEFERLNSEAPIEAKPDSITDEVETEATDVEPTEQTTAAVEVASDPAPVIEVSAVEVAETEPIAETPTEAEPIAADPIAQEAEQPKPSAPTVRCKAFDEILMWVKEDIPVYLWGPSGTGKDITCMQVADALGIEYHSHNAVQNSFDIVGYTDGHGVYHETELFKAWTKGGVCSITELDASDEQVLNILNEAFSNGYMIFDGKRYRKHPMCRIMASGNTCGTGATSQYTGRVRIDEATLNRFELIEVDYDTRVETAIAGADIAEFAADFRAAAKECHIDIVRSYRQSRHLEIAMRADNFPRLYGSAAIEKAIDRCFRRYMSADDFKMVALHCRAAKNAYTRALRKLADAI